MTTTLSGSRPIVVVAATTHCFSRRFLNCRVIFGIVRSSAVSPPRQPPPPAIHDLHDHYGDVVGAAVAVGGLDQVIANPLRMPQSRDGARDRRFRDRARQPVAA